ncbi:LCP family protein [Nonomuraea thailandensis]
MMLLHIPEGSDKPTLVSLPRDSAVTIPGKGRDKLNSAYAIGGPKLLVRTVETVTGVHVDHYMEIGFAGFVDIVDAIGGVEINVRAAVNDPKAGLNLKKGVQELSGSQALGYVRTRKGGALPDFERTKRQRQFLGAVVKKAASPGCCSTRSPRSRWRSAPRTRSRSTRARARSTCSRWAWPWATAR